MFVEHNSQKVYMQNEQLIGEYRRAYRLTDSDNVHIYTLPKSKAGKLAGSFIYKALSPKALRLQSDIYGIKRKIKNLEMSDAAPGEKSKSINRLKVLMKYTEGALNAEIAALPRSGFIVIAEDE